MAHTMHITYRMTALQRECLATILSTCYDNEHDKANGDDDSRYSNDLLYDVWQMVHSLDAAPRVNDVVAWRMPRWFPLEMIIEQYGPDNFRELDDGTIVTDVYEQVWPLLYQADNVLQAALDALCTAQERYHAMGFYEDADNADEVAQIDNAIATIKLNLEEA